MGSSFTEYQNFGFWSKDWLLESWLRMLALNLPDKVYELCWLRDLRDDWLLQSAGLFTGFVSPNLDQYLSHGDRRALITESAKSLKAKIHLFEDRIPVAYFFALGISFVPYREWVPREDLESIAARFIDLLEGKLTTTASTSPTLPAPWITPD
jgi:hypothetical protein